MASCFCCMLRGTCYVMLCYNYHMQRLSSEYYIQRPKRGIRNTLVLLAGLVLIAAVVVVVYYFTKVNQAATSDSHPVQFTVDKGLSTREIATELNDKKVINNKYIFIIYSKLHDVGDKIQAGSYSLDSNMTVAEVIEVLTKGKVVSTSRKVTLIEGQTNKQITKNLADDNIVTSANFTAALAADGYDFSYSVQAVKVNYQGFLFPDTYEIGKTDTAKDIVQKMLTNFQTKFTDKMYTDSQAKNMKLIDVITMASIIEKEVGRNTANLTDQDLTEMQKERELVASVFYNRLSVGMPFESDATVNYVTGKGDRSATIEDTKIKSPYNTYQVKGLPPGPISNPGLGSLQAAVYPAESDYLYFLNSPDGTAYFAKTLAEHNANRAKYLR